MINGNQINAFKICLGRHRVFVEDDPCTNGKEDKYLTITVTHCGEDEFTCSDGACVNMDRR